VYQSAVADRLAGGVGGVAGPERVHRLAGLRGDPVDGRLSDVPPETSQVEYWNGPAADRWIAARERLDRSMASLPEAALAQAAPRPGERVLDVGCGCGTTSLLLAERVAPDGAVLGVDLSGPMLAEARRRAPALTFLEADAGRQRFDSRFDLAFSRFGVMFFADPTAAFGNLRAALAPGGRMTFVCWRAFRDNPWAFMPLMVSRDLLPAMEPFDPDAPGPFALADRDRVQHILSGAGFADIAIDSHDDHMRTGDTADEAADYALLVGPLSRALADLSDDVRALARTRVAEAVTEFVTPRGVEIPAATWLVSARA
jgi:SAM-dependent methyltransferase